MKIDKEDEEVCVRQYVTVTSGMRGIFPVLVGVFKGKYGEYHDPILTGLTCKDSAQAHREAEAWAKAEEVEYVI